MFSTEQKQVELCPLVDNREYTHACTQAQSQAGKHFGQISHLSGCQRVQSRETEAQERWLYGLVQAQRQL